MVASVFTPDGIVISTVDSDTYCLSSIGGSNNVEMINIVGHPHVVTFWNRYAFVFHQMEQFNYKCGIDYILAETMMRWKDEIPPIYEVMPYLKKQIIDNNIDVIGIMGGYSCPDENGIIKPYVYQILGENIRRINADTNGRILYNCVFLEKEITTGRLLRDIQVRNGEEWELLPPLNIRCDLFSVRKAMDITEFILNTAESIININSSDVHKHHIENVIITPDKLTIV